MERSTNFFLKDLYLRKITLISIWPNYRYVLHAKMNANLILPITDQTSSFDSENIIKNWEVIPNSYSDTFSIFLKKTLYWINNLKVIFISVLQISSLLRQDPRVKKSDV